MSSEPLHNSRFLKACRGEKTDVTPIWLMRQAGRYMPEYQAVRSKTTFLGLCKTPELACQVTVEAQQILGVDAAILFADLLPILEPMGFALDYKEGEGPTIDNPIRETRDVDRVREHNPVESMPFVYDAIRLIRRALKPDIPLIGFSGLPFTLAAYAIEGGGSKHFTRVKTFMWSDEGAWRTLMTRLADTAIKYCNAQIDAGAQAIQLFDSWVGCLGPDDYRRYVAPYSKRVIDGVRNHSTKTPIIHFGVGTATFIDQVADAGGDVIGMDWHTPIASTWQRLGVKAVQGNLDPVTLFAPRDVVLREAKRILDDAGGRTGHIFNLGHGILPGTPVDNVKALVNYVHESKI